MGKFDIKKEQARSLYVKGRINRKEISQIVGVTEKTLRTWIIKEDWDSLKEAQTVTRQQLLQDAFSQLKAVNQKIDEIGGVPDKVLSDAKTALRKEIEFLESNPLHVYCEVFDELTEWVIENKPAKALEYSKLFREFLEQKHKAAV
ncbi:hypothetical protein [Persicobacter sp. CCB-QB2]|uniref:terminase gpP N-terminus-related DNA-binding protein n=1 Tax=Persicobacter sp. CCB-QB2 TaxID=1561025 RepID=UPI0006A9D7F4|nr:hypothetical protein [Persicobacter sp. CCB-QB2]